MVNFKIQHVTKHITRIFGICTELMYLVEGENSAVLIDTGSGFGSLKAVVDKLTSKPVKVLLTHGHLDHAMGAAEFQTVYMNSADKELFKLHGRKDVRMGGLKDSKFAQDYNDAADYIPTADCESFLDLHDGDTFDLGGIHVDVYDCKGHTKGSMVMLVREERYLILGDALNNFTFLFLPETISVQEYKQNVLELQKKVSGKYDTALCSHGFGMLSAFVIEEILVLCDKILSGTDDKMPFDFMDQKAFLAVKMPPEEIGQANIVYNPQHIK